MFEWNLHYFGVKGIYVIAENKTLRPYWVTLKIVKR